MRDRFKEATALAILDAAEAVFSESGWQGAKMEEIASRAGVSVGTLYNHFEDRSSLFVALVDSRFEELKGRLDAAEQSSAAKPFADRVRALVGALADHSDAHQRFLALLMEGEHTRGEGKVEVTNSTRKKFSVLFERTERLIADGVKNKEIKAEGSEIYSAFLIGMLRGLHLKRAYCSPPPGESLRHHADEVVSFFLRGAGAHP